MKSITTETNAERLAGIAEDACIVEDGITGKPECVELKPEDFVYLFQQAERAEYLEGLARQLVGEETLHQQGIYETEMRKLTKENARLREAVKQSLEAHKWNNEESAQILERALKGESE